MKKRSKPTTAKKSAKSKTFTWSVRKTSRTSRGRLPDNFSYVGCGK